MHDPTNPYASPITTDIHPAAAEWLSSGAASLSRVAAGLGVIYAGLLSMLFAVMVLVAEQLARIPELYEPAFYAAGFLFLVGMVLDFIGTIFCLATPAETKARGLIYASAFTMLIWLLLMTVQVYRAIKGMGPLPQATVVAEQVLGAVTVLTFILYLRRLAKFIGRRDLASRGTGVFTYFCVLLLGQFAAQVYFANGGEMPFGFASFALLIGVVVIYAVALVLYANFVTYLRKAIRTGGK